MENKAFTFHISAYDIEKLLPQASKALEKRTELVSRARHPAMWRMTDSLNSAAQGRTRSRRRTRIMSVICLLLGIFLFVPGLVEPRELLVPLLVGAAAIGAGIGGLWRSRKRRKNPLDKSAKRLLAGKDVLSAEEAIKVSFSETGMTIPTEDNSGECVQYGNFECVIETEDLFLLVYDTRVTVLQKTDLAAGNIDDFCDFVSQRVEKYRSI